MSRPHEAIGFDVRLSRVTIQRLALIQRPALSLAPSVRAPATRYVTKLLAGQAA